MNQTPEQLAVWKRINLGTATPEDHKKVIAWSNEYFNKNRQTAQAKTDFESWFRDSGIDVLTRFRQLEEPDFDEHWQGFLAAFSAANLLIRSDGMESYFASPDGDVAVEAAECCNKMGLSSLSEVFAKAIGLFGKTFPRNHSDRLVAIKTMKKELAGASSAYFEIVNEMGYRKVNAQFDTFFNEYINS